MVNDELKRTPFPAPVQSPRPTVAIILQAFRSQRRRMPGADRASIIGENRENLLKLCRMF
jgi:hypothetical protein